MSKHIAITGNIGSGKSTVAELFHLFGIPIYNADLEAKKILNTPTVVEEICAKIGYDILNSNHQIDPRKLANILFSDPSKLEMVNKIIHPKVIDHYKKWAEAHNNSPFTLFESAIVYEHNFNSFFDGIIVVYCPDYLAIERASRRDNTQKEIIQKRLNNQISAEIKKEMADYVIFNYDNFSIIAQCLELFKRLSN